MGFSVLTRWVLSDEAGVSIVGWIAEEITAGRGKIDKERSL